MKITKLLLAALTVAPSYAASTPPRAHQLTESYTFTEYLDHFSKSYPDPDEYQRRSQIFHSNLQKILNHNEGKLDADGKVKSGYVMGVNRFTDLEVHELPMGYSKGHRLYRGQEVEEGGVVTAMERRLDGTASYSQPPDFQMEEIASLPTSVDWRSHMLPAPSQGGCGDCWAFAATACVESHLAIAENSPLEKLSEMNMFECSPDPQQCGGSGKCEGSIPELGWNYIADLTAKNMGGMYLADELPYEANDKECEGLTDGLTPKVGLTGWTLLPSNDYKATMNALHKVGPLALAVAAGDWSMYESGIFTSDSTTVNHAVVLVGYGVDETTGEKYYLIRNSWGTEYGENGYIRVKRTDDDDNVCGVDDSPLEGIACALDENGNKVKVEHPKVCGDSAILFDTSYPVGVHRLF